MIGVDVGTTHCKAGLFDQSGQLLYLASRPTPTHQTADGSAYYDPDELWNIVASLIREVATQSTEPIPALGITSMAETGVLLDRKSGVPRSRMLPWFNKCASAQAEWLKWQDNSDERFMQFGIYPTFKCGLAKLLWLREQGVSFEGAVWLSAADFIVYKLTGVFVTDYSLAGRTYAFDIRRKAWDRQWLEGCGVDPCVFPDAVPSGTLFPLTAAAELGLSPDTQVCVAGHDHVCAALAVGATHPGTVLDSMGTAETLVGALDNPDPRLAQSGLLYGCHVVSELYYWMGSISASGGSVEWLRARFGSLNYDDLQSLLAKVNIIPTGILYFPYLSGSGLPRSDSSVHAAFVGLEAQHHEGDLLMAVLEGTAYEMETIRRTAERFAPIENIVVVGGGTRNPYWLQAKANISGIPVEVFPVTEAALLGAAMVAGLDIRSIHNTAPHTIQPDKQRHTMYREIYEQGYVALQEPLRTYYRKFSG